ncbi:MAG: hypothetical protein JWP27_1682, partial [Flaviaesturariibacter sp.]|nr:hypothetical protein [Flaviaesturariibacter sp.]
MENADHTRYTASDIQRYHEGGLSPADRHALEKAALEDPFLADALDGLALAPTAGADLAALRTSLAQRTQQPRRGIVLLYRQYKGAFRIAAAVLLIAAAGWIATTLTIDRKQPLAEVPTSKTAPAAAVADSVPASVDSAAVSSDVAQAETSASAPVVAPTDRQRERATARAWAQARAASKAAADDTLSVLMTMNQHASMNNGLDRRLIQPQANATRTFTGRIVDTNGVAVPFASVSIAEQKLTTLADSR